MFGFYQYRMLTSLVSLLVFLFSCLHINVSNAATGVVILRQDEISRMVKVNEDVYVIDNPYQMYSITDSQVIITQWGNGEPLVVDLLNGTILYQLSADTSLLEAAAEQLNTYRGDRRIVDVRSEVSLGRFSWFAKGRSKHLKPRYKSSCKLSDSTLAVLVLIPAPYFRDVNGERAEAMAQVVGVVRYNFVSRKPLDFRALPCNDTMCTQYLSIIPAPDGGYFISTRNDAIEAHDAARSQQFLSVFSGGGSLLGESVLLPDAIRGSHSWFDFTASVEPTSDGFATLSRDGVILECRPSSTPGYASVSILDKPDLPPVDGTTLYGNPVWFGDTLEVAVTQIDTVTKESRNHLATYIKREGSSVWSNIRITRLADDVLGPACTIADPRKVHGRIVARLVRRGEDWHLKFGVE